MRVQRDARGRWQRHQRHKHLHRPSRADAAAASTATGTAHTTTATAAACAVSWLHAAGASASAGASFLARRTLLAASEPATTSAYTPAYFASLAALGPAQSALATVSAALATNGAASTRASGRILSSSACDPAAAYTSEAAAVLPHRVSQEHRLRRGRRVCDQHDSQRRGGARQVQPDGWRGNISYYFFISYYYDFFFYYYDYYDYYDYYYYDGLV